MRGIWFLAIGVILGVTFARIPAVDAPAQHDSILLSRSALAEVAFAAEELRSSDPSLLYHFQSPTQSVGLECLPSGYCRVETLVSHDLPTQASILEIEPIKPSDLTSPRRIQSVSLGIHRPSHRRLGHQM